jgi:DNA modification methylase
LSQPALTLLTGDAQRTLAGLEPGSVQTCVTSPPFFGLRDYGVRGQIGLEATIDAYVARLVDVFRAVRRVLRDDGTLWLNLGDSYNGGGGYSPDAPSNRGGNDRNGGRSREFTSGARRGWPSLSQKQLLGIPWRVAFALQADGWVLRSDVIWAKPNPMPESVRDRPTKSHEYLFLFAKQAKYYYDADAVREPASGDSGFAKQRARGPANWSKVTQKRTGRASFNVVTGNEGNNRLWVDPGHRNRRTVWTVATAPLREAHFAAFPPKLVEPCVLASTSAAGCCGRCGAPWRRVVERTGTVSQTRRRERLAASQRTRNVISGGFRSTLGAGAGGDQPLPARQTLGWEPTCACAAGDPGPCTVLDPFSGAATTGLVALTHGRRYVGIDLNAKYHQIARRRLAAAGLLTQPEPRTRRLAA